MPERKTRIVPDVNVIISAIIAPSGIPGRIYDAWKRRDIQVVTSPVIISKTLEVVQRPHIQDTFSLTQTDIQIRPRRRYSLYQQMFALQRTSTTLTLPI